VEDQHKLIKGYRDLSEAEIDAINAIKNWGEDVRTLIENVSTIPDVDMCWVKISRTHLQQGFMALVRAVAKPESF
jgi:hypothetical protein